MVLPPDGQDEIGVMARWAAVAMERMRSTLTVMHEHADALAHAADEHYNNLKTFKADFTEIYQGPGISRSESGTLWLKKPGRMRWEYLQPREKLFLTDSHTAFFYVPGERQARKPPLRRHDQR